MYNTHRKQGTHSSFPRLKESICCKSGWQHNLLHTKWTMHCHSPFVCKYTLKMLSFIPSSTWTNLHFPMLLCVLKALSYFQGTYSIFLLTNVYCITNITSKNISFIMQTKGNIKSAWKITNFDCTI